MKMFEQDFLSVWISPNHGLLTDDVASGPAWFAAMGDAAAGAGATVQLCMLLPAAALASVNVPAMTNARASRDATRGIAVDDQTWKVARLHAISRGQEQEFASSRR